MTDEKLKELQEHLHHVFKAPGLLKESITHKSYLNESREAEGKDNERLEFLGDAVLDLATSERLTSDYPDSQEGELSKMKARIVNERALARIARRLSLGDYLLLGKGEEMTQGREKSSLLADALEAVIAAVYLDSGYGGAREFIHRHFKDEFEELKGPAEAMDYKTELQEYCQREWNSLPQYRVLRESGPDHQKTFEVEVSIEKRRAGIGRGRSKKEAEQQAARAALESAE